MTLYGLIFDVDGVIADTEAVNARASIRVFKDLFGVKGVKRQDFEAGLGRGAAEYVKAAASVHGLELTDEQIEKATELRQQYFLNILNQEPLPPFPGVLELIEKAVNIVPGSSRLTSNLGFLYLQTGQYEKAEQTLNEAIRLNSEEFWAYFNLGLIYIRHERLSLARTHMKRAVEGGADLNMASFHLAVIENAAGNSALARQYAREFLALHRENDRYRREAEAIVGREH